MKVLKPYFYDEFKCIGSDCMDTCCAGWQIDIDEDTLKKYDAIDGEFGLELKENIHRGDKSNFVLKEDNRCSFLNGNNLCDIYIKIGEDKLSKTCTNYPRTSQRYDDIYELNLALSCPEVAKFLVTDKNPLEFDFAEATEEIDADLVDSDPVLFDALIYGRGLSVDFMQDRGIDINKRKFLSLLIADTVQKHINKGNVSEVGSSLDKYVDTNFLKNILNEFDRMSINIKHKAEYYCLLINTFIKIELSNKIFAKYVNEVIEYFNKLLNEGDLSVFDILEKAYEAANKDKESIYENFLVYQLFHNYMKAYKTKDLQKEITMIIAMSSFIKLIFMIHWQKSGEKLDDKDIIEVLYSYTRSIVHVKENTDIIMEAIREKKYDSMANLYFLIK